MVTASKEIILDGNKITGKDALFDNFRAQLAPDTVCGSNLDALHDILTSISQPTELVILNEHALSTNLKDYWVHLFNVIVECLDENHNLILTFVSKNNSPDELL